MVVEGGYKKEIVGSFIILRENSFAVWAGDSISRPTDWNRSLGIWKPQAILNCFPYFQREPRLVASTLEKIQFGVAVFIHALPRPELI